MKKKIKINDGTLEEFPPGTLFEIGMLEGCAAGLIHAAGDSSNYFYGVTQPIYFKAAETLEGESDTVKILVGLIEQQQGGMQMVGGGEKEMQPEAKSNYLKSPPGGVPSNPLGFACFIGDFESEINAPAKFVVQDECPTTRPLLDEEIQHLVITEVTESMYEITQEEDNHQQCDNSRDEGGWATAITPPFTGNVYKYFNSYFYIDEMMFSLEWGFCIAEINNIYSDPTIIDEQNGVLTGIQNINEKEDIIRDFNSFVFGESRGRRIRYYPLPKTREHELKHISQYQDSLKKYYDIALFKINWIEEPPPDWCSTAESYERYFNERKEQFDLFLDEAEDDFRRSHDELYGDQYEEEADKAGIDYLKYTLIPKVKKFPH